MLFALPPVQLLTIIVSPGVDMSFASGLRLTNSSCPA